VQTPITRTHHQAPEHLGAVWNLWHDPVQIGGRFGGPLLPMSESTTRTFRLSWVDTAKGFAIILVVFGHVLWGLINSKILTWTPITRFVEAWIYSFHMPAFFFLSGLFLFRSTARPWVEVASDKLRTIAYPYFIWSMITLAIKSEIGAAANHPYNLSDILLILYKPIDQFWFLYVLFVLLIVVSILLKLGIKHWVIFGLAVLIYPGLLPMFSHETDILMEIRLMTIYLALGVVVGSDQNIRMISCIGSGWLVLGVVIGLMISSLAGWSELHSQIIEPGYFRPLFAVSGIVAVIALAHLTDKAKLGAPIRFLGRHSLQIYLVHTIASAGVRVALFNFFHLSASAPHVILGTLAGLYLPIGLVSLFKRGGLQFAFTFPPAPYRVSRG
jgi:fucose 4-O-acetylase-like acetyltransferase